MNARRLCSLVLCTVTLALSLRAADAPAQRLLPDPAAPGVEPALEPTSAQVVAVLDAEGLLLTIAGGPESYPGVVVKPVGAATWDLSAFGHIETQVTNLGDKRAILVLQPECDGDWRDSPWSAQNFSFNPRETKTISVLLGYNYGKASPKFRPEAVKQLRLFSGKSDDPRVFRITRIQAAGAAGEKPPVDPARLAVRPARGVLFDAATKIDPVAQLVAKGGAKASLSANTEAIQLAFGGGKEESVTFKPVAGYWNLGQGVQVRVTLRNDGQTATAPGVRCESRRDGKTECTETTTAVLAPGAEVDVVVPFAGKVPWKGVVEKEQEVLEGKRTWEGQPGTGTGYRSNLTTGITVVATPGTEPQSLQILSVVCDSPTLRLPEWLGQRPPVEGDWIRTFEDDFDGDVIDLTKWNIYAANYWDKQTHFSKDNVIVKDGKLALRVERKRGHHNDDPAAYETDYTTGVADTYGKWTQRYGYFEARVKLPTAPNLFYAFWMMPDRGLGAGEQWQRASTKDGGMEFDIMEGLSIWGINRHDFGCHWDGYDKYHKSNGVFSCYAQADAEGFIVVGMLWTPGLIVLYDNGVEAARWESPRIAQVPAHFILDHVTGGWETEGMDDSQLPADLVFDWVRAWQRKDLASPGDGPKPNKGTLSAPTE